MSDEYKRQWLDDIAESIKNIHRLYLALCDKESTAKQRRAVDIAQKELLAYEMRRFTKVKKAFGL